MLCILILNLILIFDLDLVIVYYAVVASGVPWLRCQVGVNQCCILLSHWFPPQKQHGSCPLAHGVLAFNVTKVLTWGTQYSIIPHQQIRIKGGSLNRYIYISSRYGTDLSSTLDALLFEKLKYNNI